MNEPQNPSGDGNVVATLRRALMDHGGDMAVKEARAALARAGFNVSDSTMQRARRKIGARVTKRGFDGWRWTLTTGGDMESKTPSTVTAIVKDTEVVDLVDVAAARLVTLLGSDDAAIVVAACAVVPALVKARGGSSHFRVEKSSKRKLLVADEKDRATLLGLVAAGRLIVDEEAPAKASHTEDDEDPFA